MKPCRQLNVYVSAAFLTMITVPAHAETTVNYKQFEHDTRIKTVGGALAVRANKKDDTATDVVLKDKVITTLEETGVGFDHKFSVRGNDVVLISHPSGAACPATYYFLMVSPDGKAIFSGNDGAGNCSDTPTLAYDDKSVTISMPVYGDGRPSKTKQIERWVWDYTTKPPVKQK